MLVLSRKNQERIVVGDGAVVITVVECGHNRVKIGVEAAGMNVHRKEVFDRIRQEKGSDNSEQAAD